MATFRRFNRWRSHVSGSLSKGGGSFKIDDPLDPENKYLSHSFVESPDMMNIYNGLIRLDARGEAWVVLPDYFEALNRDFRYQLTSVGASQPRLYIASEVKGNRFKIARRQGECEGLVAGHRNPSGRLGQRASHSQRGRQACRQARYLLASRLVRRWRQQEDERDAATLAAISWGMCQGTPSAVPHRVVVDLGFSPWGMEGL